MKKIIAVLLLFSVIFNIFASEASNYKLSDNSELSEKQIVEIESKEEAEPFGYKKNTIRKEVNKKKNELSFSSRIWKCLFIFCVICLRLFTLLYEPFTIQFSDIVMKDIL